MARKLGKAREYVVIENDRVVFRTRDRDLARVYQNAVPNLCMQVARIKWPRPYIYVPRATQSDTDKVPEGSTAH